MYIIPELETTRDDLLTHPSIAALLSRYRTISFICFSSTLSYFFLLFLSFLVLSFLLFLCSHMLSHKISLIFSTISVILNRSVSNNL